jgi:hypothetical protein
VAVCADCATKNPQGARFCNGCGLALPAAADAAEQRKVVTVLFTDLVGSTALGERFDPETIRAVLTRYFEMVRTVIEEHGGTVEKFIGDAAMAVFGIPTVREDDALRAARAALELQRRLRTLNAELSARWGIELTTGPDDQGELGLPEGRLVRDALPAVRQARGSRARRCRRRGCRRWALCLGGRGCRGRRGQGRWRRATRAAAHNDEDDRAGKGQPGSTPRKNSH